MMGKSKAGHERLTSAERKQRAVELRKLGFSYQKIADQMGISQSGAHKLVTSALQELNEKTAESAAELRRLELERLDEWLLRIAQEIKNGKVLGAIDRGIRIQARRSRLLGLDAPTSVKLSGRDEYRFNEVLEAAKAGDELAIQALQKIAAGENAAAICEDWKQKSVLPLASAADTAKMTHKELAKAAQGKLTFEELAAIRERPAEGEVETEGQAEGQ